MNAVSNETKTTSGTTSNHATNIIGVTGIEARNQSSTTGFFGKDLHGDVLYAFTSSGIQFANYNYDAWGTETTADASTWEKDNPIRYNGQYYDSETGMYYLRARYYDPNVNRFISEDPIEDGINWYAYAGNNPIMFVDPSGKNAAIAAAEAFLQTPVGQQMTQQLTNLANQAGVSLTNFVMQNLPWIQQAADYISQYGVAAWDWATNTVAPWVDGKIQQATQTINDTAEKVGNWINEKINNVTNGDPNKKPSLKKVNNKSANELAQKNGFKDAHDFKESFVGRENISKFNIKIDKNTGEIFLESVKKGGATIATGYFK